LSVPEEFFGWTKATVVSASVEVRRWAQLPATLRSPFDAVGLNGHVVSQRHGSDKNGGGDGTRTHDFLLAKQVL